MSSLLAGAVGWRRHRYSDAAGDFAEQQHGSRPGQDAHPIQKVQLLDLEDAVQRGTLMISTCTTATVPAIVRKVGLFKRPRKPLFSGVRERQLIWFHTWKKT